MAHHVHKIVHDHIQVVVQQVVDIGYQMLTGLVGQDFGVACTQVFFAKSFQVGFEKLVFLQVFSAFLVIVFPILGKLLFNINGQQAGEEGIACILCGGR